MMSYIIGDAEGTVQLGAPTDGSAGFVWDNEGPQQQPQEVLMSTWPVSATLHWTLVVTSIRCTFSLSRGHPDLVSAGGGLPCGGQPRHDWRVLRLCHHGAWLRVLGLLGARGPRAVCRQGPGACIWCHETCFAVHHRPPNLQAELQVLGVRKPWRCANGRLTVCEAVCPCACSIS